MDLEYVQNDGYVTNFNGISEDKTTEVSCSDNFIWNAYASGNDDNINIKSSTKTREVYINEIIFNGGKVLFNRSAENRLDRVFDWQASSPRALDNISILDEYSNKAEQILLKTSYFNQAKSSLSDKEIYLRLKLDEIIFSPTGQTPKSYKFTYNSIDLPRKDSYSIDYWGYYNGADNTNLLTYKYKDVLNQEIYGEGNPSTFSTIVPFYYNNGGKILVVGADREPNENYAQAGLLNTIYYPTGGKIKFEFELNQYTRYGVNNISPKVMSVSAAGTSEDTFTLARQTFVLLEYDFKNLAYGGFSGSEIYNHVMNTNVSIQKSDGTNIIKFFPTKIATSPYFSNTTTSYISILLSPGTYKVKAYNDNFTYFSINLKAKILEDTVGGVYTKKGGGVRIKSITSYDGVGVISQKRYAYFNDDGQSSGILMSPIFNFYNDTQLWNYYGKIYTPGIWWNPEETFIKSLIPINLNLGAATSQTCMRNFPKRIMKAFSSSIIPEGSSAGGQAVGYSQVTVTESSPFPFSQPSNLGKSVYTYKNIPDTQLGWFLPNLKEYGHSDNGQLLTERHYDSAGKILNEKINTYSEGYTYSVKGFRVMNTNYYTYCKDLHSSDPSYNCSSIDDVPFNRFYTQDLSWWYPSQIVEKNYPSGGGTPVVTTKNFSYDNLSHKQLTKEETIFPDGFTAKKTYQYADEAGNQLMKDKNMIGIPLVSETQKVENGVAKTLSKIETVFPKTTAETAGTNGLELPLQTKTYSLDNLATPNTFLTYDKYDTKGNILQYSGKGLKPTTFIWGYKQTLPIAKIEGIGYDALMAISGVNTAVTNMISKSDLDKDQATENDLITALDAFRNNSNLANYQVSTYTYNPLIGLTSVTPPSGIRENYVYDDANRLKQVVDVNGNILKENKYNYSNGMAGDVEVATISGPDNVDIYTTYPTANAQYTFSTKYMPSDLSYYWSIAPVPSSGATSSGATYPMPYNSPSVSTTFSSGGKYKLSIYVIRPSTQESYTASKAVNVNYVISPSSGGTLSPLSSIQLNTSSISLSGSMVSGYMVFTPLSLNGTTDIALVPGDKVPAADRTVTYQQVNADTNRTWTFVFKSTGVLTASYTGTPLTKVQSIYIPSFTYQK